MDKRTLILFTLCLGLLAGMSLTWTVIFGVILTSETQSIYLYEPNRFIRTLEFIVSIAGFVLVPATITSLARVHRRKRRSSCGN